MNKFEKVKSELEIATVDRNKESDPYVREALDIYCTQLARVLDNNTNEYVMLSSR